MQACKPVFNFLQIKLGGYVQINLNGKNPGVFTHANPVIMSSDRRGPCQQVVRRTIMLNDPHNNDPHDSDDDPPNDDGSIPTHLN